VLGKVHQGWIERRPNLGGTVKSWDPGNDLL
jgi:hypothetical protein